LQQSVQQLIKRKLVRSAHDVSDGGLFISLIESAMPNNFGFDVTTDANIRKDAFLFGESQGRVVVSVGETDKNQFVDFMKTQNVPFVQIGCVTKSEIKVDDKIFGNISEIKDLYDTAIEKLIEK
jgi:phosphoribosylformylglycinamidine synthase